MNLQTQVSKFLWEAIESNYLSKQYTNSILDSIYFLGDIIREKTGLTADGQALIGQAFGGKSPKLKLNKFQTESEKNIQRGMENLLRGLYQLIRNPRSHGKYKDKKEDADATILFVNYLINQINQSKSTFNLDKFIARVIEENFVESERYADAIIKEIPKNKKIDVLLEVYSKKDSQENAKLYLVINKLLNEIEDNEKDIIYKVVSDELKTTSHVDDIRKIIAIFPSESWQYYEEVAKIRIEDMLIKSIKKGSYNFDNEHLYEGHFGTWASGLIKYSELKDDFIDSLLDGISSINYYNQNYIMKYFINQFTKFDDYDFKIATRIFNEAFIRGDKRFYNAYDRVLIYNNKWKKALMDSYNNFKEQEIDLQSQKALPKFDDDIPF